MSGEHAQASSLFSPQSKFKVEYSAVVDAPKNIHRFNESAKKQRREAAPDSPSSSECSSDSDNARETRGATHDDKNKKKTTKSDIEDGSELKDQSLQRTVFVGNLSETITKKILKAHFQKYGTIESIRFRSMPLKEDSKVPRRVAAASGTIDESKGSFHAYIIFENKESVSQALQENMKVLHDRHLRVDRAAVNKMRVKMVGAAKGSRAAAEMVSGSHQVRYDVTKSVFVGNLPLQIEDEDVIRFFIAGLGTGSESLLEAVRVVRDPKTSVGKGIAFVLFKTRKAAKDALKLDRKALQGRKLRIQPAESNPSAEATQYKPPARSSKPWQGATATKSGRLRGAQPLKASSQGIRAATGTKITKKRTGKRPAVAARKLLQKQQRKKT
ncbi:hypothetical protein M9435_002445 [Picochlorum sp. BPE23]|nr:hypothetical protein M9435_002445 [Picochlorum sp. BPE23]